MPILTYLALPQNPLCFFVHCLLRFPPLRFLGGHRWSCLGRPYYSLVVGGSFILWTCLGGALFEAFIRVPGMGSLRFAQDMIMSTVDKKMYGTPKNDKWKGGGRSSWLPPLFHLLVIGLIYHIPIKNLSPACQPASPCLFCRAIYLYKALPYIGAYLRGLSETHLTSH